MNEKLKDALWKDADAGDCETEMGIAIFIATLLESGFAIVRSDEHDARNRAVAALDSHLTMDELKLAEKHCEWPAFKHAFSAVMKHRRANVALLAAAKVE